MCGWLQCRTQASAGKCIFQVPALDGKQAEASPEAGSGTTLLFTQTSIPLTSSIGTSLEKVNEISIAARSKVVSHLMCIGRHVDHLVTFFLGFTQVI